MTARDFAHAVEPMRMRVRTAWATRPQLCVVVQGDVRARGRFGPRALLVLFAAVATSLVARPTAAQFGWSVALALAVALVAHVIKQGGLGTYRIVSARLFLSLPLAGYTVSDLARRWRIGPEKVRAFLARGELVGVNVAMSLVGRPQWRITRESVEQFEKRRSSAPQPKPTRRHKQTNGVDYYR